MHFDRGLWIFRTGFASYCAMDIVEMARSYVMEVMEVHESHLSKEND
jgi:hypothetical protein